MSDAPVKTKKGFIQVNITGFIWHQNITDAQKAEPDAMGDFVEIQPIMYDIMVPVTGEIPAGEMLTVPQGMEQEVLNVLGELAKLIRLHKPDPSKIVQVGVRDPSIQTAPKKKLLDSTGGELKPTSH